MHWLGMRTRPAVALLCVAACPLIVCALSFLAYFVRPENIYAAIALEMFCYIGTPAWFLFWVVRCPVVTDEDLFYEYDEC